VAGGRPVGHCLVFKPPAPVNPGIGDMANRDRWQQAERLFHAALARVEGERAAFVRDACLDDEPLRRDVESLLTFERDAQAFMQASAFEIAAVQIQSGTVTPLPGQRLGPYEIGALLGSGGMGDVYRARDTVLRRDVAIKILPDVFTADAERRARFEREARLLATLNHPHIGAIYRFEQGEGIHGLVLELVEGQTLGERLGAGPLPVRDVLTIAQQIAAALDAAHEKGIVHRDLKPSNIMITPDGVVKVLDFGLAKAGVEETTPAVIDDTRDGLILGTAAYMSPEQARGRRADKRSDIWAFGCVVWAMLTGRAAFAGDTVSDTIAAILDREPAWHTLPAETPANVRRLLRRCLEKDPRRRLRDIGDARLEFDDPSGSSSEWTDAQVPSSGSVRPLRVGLWMGSGLIVGGLIVGLGLRFVPRVATNEVVRFTVTLPRDVQLAYRMALSPDGRVLVYSGGDYYTSRLYKRTLDTLESVPIRGAEGGRNPFFSPDGASVGFFDGLELKRVPLEGGASTTVLTGEPRPRGGAGAVWLSDDTIVFASLSQGLMRVPASGGEARPLTLIDRERGEVEHMSPVALPGERAVLFTVHSGARATLRGDVVSLQTGQRTALVEGNGLHFVTSGHIAFERGGSLWVAPFDIDRLRVTGPPAPVIEGVNVGLFWSPMIAVGAEGSLAYGTGAPLANQQGTLVWVDRTGREEPVDVPPRAWWWPHISPDGRRIGLHDHDSGNMDAWMYELDHGPLIRVTYDPFPDGVPLWSPEGTRIAFWSRRGGAPSNLYLRSADLSGSDERLTTSPHNQFPFSWADDGKLLVFHEVSHDTGTDIGVVSIEGERRTQLIIRGPFHEARPAVSQDGHWIAYESNLSGRWEVYVQPFPELSTRWQVSTQGGESPTWAADGRELFYRRGKAMMSVAIQSSGNSFRYSTSKVLFDGPYAPEDPSRFSRSYAVAPDGRRFLMMKEEESHGHAPDASQIVVVRKWAEELKRLVPATR
jgi:serine/threonine protein kinase